MASKRAKRGLFCGRCGGAAAFYRKGKAHRVLICGNCGVLATNPLPIAALATLPALGRVATGLASSGIIKGKSSSPKEPKQTINVSHRDIDTYNTGERIADALR